MAKRGNKRNRGDARLRLVRTDETRQQAELAAELQPLMAEIRHRMRQDDPIALLGFVSAIVAASDGRHGFEDHSAIALEDLVDSFIDLDLAETTAVLQSLAHLAPDEAMRARIVTALDRRRQPLPRWLSDLAQTRVTAAARLSFPGEPGGNLVLEFVWPGGIPGTFVIFDEGAGRGVKDAFPAPDSIDELTAKMRGASPVHAGLTVLPLDLPTARATVEQVLALGANRPVTEETDSWPGARPIVEWLVTLMPPGGTALRADAAHQGAKELDEFIEDFARSTEATAIGFDLDDPGDEAGIGAVVEFGWRSGHGDPFRWDADTIDELFVDWLPATVLPDDHTARRLPIVVEAYVAWAAGRKGQSPRQKSALVRAVREVAPEYLDVATSQTAQELRRVLADYEDLTEMWDSLGLRIIGEEGDGAEVHTSVRTSAHTSGYSPHGRLPTAEEATKRVVAHAAQQVGGPAALEALDDTPLPDEPFDAAALPEDIRERVDEVRLLVDDFADRSFGVEFRTACRRYLARVAAADPQIFRRAGRADTAAAAVAWTIGRANRLVAHGGRSMAAQDLMAHFGLKGSPSQRAQVLLNALETGSYDEYGPRLGTPDLLVSSTRAGLIETRDLAASGRLFNWD